MGPLGVPLLHRLLILTCTHCGADEACLLREGVGLEDADEGEGAVDLSQYEHGAIVERDDAVGGRGSARRSARGRGLILRILPPVDARDVSDDIDHICAQRTLCRKLRAQSAHANRVG